MFYLLSFLFIVAALLLAIALGRHNRRLGRMSPRDYLGMALGVLIFFGASWLFAGIAQDVMSGANLTSIDRNVVQWFDFHRTPGLTAVMLIVTRFASTFSVVSVTVATGLFLGWKCCWYRLMTLILVVPCGVALIPLLKMTFHRQRPNIEDAYSNFQGYSFPSGHAMTATLLYGLLAVLAVQALKGWWLRTWAVLAAVAMVLLVSFSRIYLGAHYFSDVLGGIAAGIAWLTLSLTAINTLRQTLIHHKQSLENQ
ncbi:MAG: phosphatase PAP2 family protein [Kiritimatiellae bacterium]|jgi:membrane-associated phospholipid phosphatase|nr:phosphatase PAP2 family protein [Kiritimatiellia bacterium]